MIYNHASTQNLSIVSFQHPDKIHNVYFIDTPGFDGTNTSDAETLAHVAHYLSVSYANRVYISGILFMHRISDNRMTGSTKRSIDIFKRLVGEEAFENVAIATTMWWNSEEATNTKREKSLAEEDFRDVLDGEGRMFRFDIEPETACSRTSQKALALLDHLMSRAKEGPVVLKIQSEMIDEGMMLGQTEAGKLVGDEMVGDRSHLDAQLQETLKALSGLLKEQSNKLAETYRETQDELKSQCDRIDRSLGALMKSTIEMHKMEEHRLKDRIEQMELRWQESVRSKEQQLMRIEKEINMMRAVAEEETQRLNRIDILLESVPWMAEDNRFRQRAELDQQEAFERAQTGFVDDAQMLRQEIRSLRRDLLLKQKATSKVKRFLTSGVTKTMVEGLSSGMASAAIGSIIAGSLCNVM